MNLDVLAFGPHPDDVELAMGGTLLRLAHLGYQTGIIDLTAGESATRGTPDVRASEAADAGAHPEREDPGNARSGRQPPGSRVDQ